MYLEFWIHTISWKNLLIYLGFYFLQAYFTIYINNLHYEKFQDGSKKCIDFETDYEIPDNWLWCNLGLLFNHNTGKALNSSNSTGKALTYITTSNVYWNRFELNNLKSMPFADSELEKCTVKKGDLLVCEGGDIGRAAIWNFDDEIRIQNHLHRLRVYDNVETIFYYYVLYLYKLKGKINGKGIGLQGLSSSALHSIIVPVPPIAEQKKIVMSIEKMISIIDIIESDNDILTSCINNAKSKILDLAIRGKLVPQDPNDEPASVLLERIKAEKERLIKEGKIKKSKKSTKASDTPHYENVPFEVPSSWVWTTLGEISNYGECNNVSVDSITDDDWVLELEDLEKDTAKIIQTLSRSKRSIKGVRHRFNKGDILYSKLRTYLNKVLVAPQSGYCTTEIMPFNSYCNVSSYYLNHVLRSAYFLDYTQQCGYGVKMPRLSTTDACNGMIPLPPLAEQKRIVKEIEHWFSLIDVIESGKEDLQATIKQAKSKILDLAIHGKLVPQDPNDEPASELLKRINSKAEITCDNGHKWKLPQSWCWAKGRQIFLPMKSTKPHNDEFLYIDIDSIDNKRQIINKIKSIKTANAPSRASRYTQKGDVVFSMVRPYLRNIAKVSVDGCIASTGFYVCSPIDDLNSEYCYYLMISDYVVTGLNQFMKGDNSPSINKSHIDEWLFPLPPFPEQQRIVQKIEKLFSLLDHIKKSLEV